MADINKLAPLILQWEGGYVNDPLDNGGATNMGVTVSTWQQVGYDKDGDGDIDAVDVKLLDKNDFLAVLRKYWDRWQADKIQNQSIANILVDWVWGSGKWGIIHPQRILGVTPDGIVGTATIKAINDADPEVLFSKIYAARINFLEGIVQRRSSQARFIKGWKNRLADFTFSK